MLLDAPKSVSFVFKFKSFVSQDAIFRTYWAIESIYKKELDIVKNRHVLSNLLREVHHRTANF